MSPRYNRLGLDETKVAFLSHHVDKVLTPTRVKSVRQPIVDVAMGPNHTVLVTDKGHLIAMGRNSEAQLGKGHARSVSGPEVVKAMTAKEVGCLLCLMLRLCESLCFQGCDGLLRRHVHRGCDQRERHLLLGHQVHQPADKAKHKVK